jgi:hypothetical protein
MITSEKLVSMREISANSQITSMPRNELAALNTHE